MVACCAVCMLRMLCYPGNVCMLALLLLSVSASTTQLAMLLAGAWLLLFFPYSDADS